MRRVLPLLPLLPLLLLPSLPSPVSASQLLLSAAASKSSSDASHRSTLAVPDWRVYHRTDVLLARLSSAAAKCPHAFAQRVSLVPASDSAAADAPQPPPEEVLVVTLAYGAGERRKGEGGVEEGMGVGAGGQGRGASRIGVGRGDGGARLGTGEAAEARGSWPKMKDASKGRARVLVAFGEHGREFITSEVALRLVEIVCGKSGGSAGGSAVYDDTARRRQELLFELNRTELVLVPVASAAGRKLAEAGRYCERGNSRGVDVNRNFGMAWGKKDASTVADEERPGRAAFSEVESRLMHVLAMHVLPHAYVTVHSGDGAVVLPWDAEGKLPDGAAPQRELRAVAERLRSEVCPGCRVGTSAELFGYKAYGTGVDFMHGVLKVPVTMTWEIYGDEKASDEDCVRMFNPLGSKGYEDVVNSWASAFGVLSASLHEQESVQLRLKKAKGGLGIGIGMGGLLEDSWARVASRLGSAAWTVAAYKAFISADTMPFTPTGRRRLKKLIAEGGGNGGGAGGSGGSGVTFGGRGRVADASRLHGMMGIGIGMRGAGAAGWRSAHQHPMLAVSGAAFMLFVFSAMIISVRHAMRRSRRPAWGVSGGGGGGVGVGGGSVLAGATGRNGAALSTVPNGTGSTAGLSRRIRRDSTSGSFGGDEVSTYAKGV